MAKPKVNYEEKQMQFTNLGDPPRAVPPMLALSLIFNKMCIVGAAVMSFGLIFFWLFFHPVSVLQDIELDSRGKETEGRVIQCTKTNFEVNESDVYRIEFDFNIPSGRQTGFAFTTDSLPAEGSDVEVQYLESDPTVSRIKGTRKDPVGWIGVITIIFPLIGLMIIIGAIKTGIKTVSLLKEGILTDAEVLDVRSGSRSDSSALADVVLKYTDDRGDEHTFTHQTASIKSVGDEPMELVLYNPMTPGKAYPLDEFYDKLEIDNRGELQESSPGPAMLTIGIMLLLLAPHAVYFYFHYISQLR